MQGTGSRNLKAHGKVIQNGVSNYFILFQLRQKPKQSLQAGSLRVRPRVKLRLRGRLKVRPRVKRRQRQGPPTRSPEES